MKVLIWKKIKFQYNFSVFEYRLGLTFYFENVVNIWNYTIKIYLYSKNNKIFLDSFILTNKHYNIVSYSWHKNVIITII